MILTSWKRRWRDSTTCTPIARRCRFILSNIVIVSCDWKCIICAVAVTMIFWRSWWCKRSWRKSIHIDRGHVLLPRRWASLSVWILHVERFPKALSAMQIYLYPQDCKRMSLCHVSLCRSRSEDRLFFYFYKQLIRDSASHRGTVHDSLYSCNKTWLLPPARCPLQSSWSCCSRCVRCFLLFALW